MFEQRYLTTSSLREFTLRASLPRFVSALTLSFFKLKIIFYVHNLKKPIGFLNEGSGKSDILFSQTQAGVKN